RFAFRVGHSFACADFSGRRLVLPPRLITRKIAPLYTRSDVGVTLILWDVDFAAPIKPRQAKLAMPRCGSNVDLFISRPASLLPCHCLCFRRWFAVGAWLVVAAGPSWSTTGHSIRAKLFRLRSTPVVVALRGYIRANAGLRGCPAFCFSFCFFFVAASLAAF